MKRMHCLGFTLLFGAAAALAIIETSRVTGAHAAEPAAKAEPQPVEDDMHEFMEYAFQPNYRRLKAAMAAEPADNNGWKAIKAESLVLAEGGNLLLLRTPRDQADAWRQHSLAVRDLGGKLYQAGKSKDYVTARKHYEAMLKSCNRCHDDFADGEHQLTP